LRYGGKVIGICGGLQMLGTQIHDPDGVEGKPASYPGLGLLELETTLQPVKQLTNRRGKLAWPHLGADVPVQGYEIHAGVSQGAALQHPALYLDDSVDVGQPEGAVSADGQILATYLHGLFDEPDALTALLDWAGLAQAEAFDVAAVCEQQLERLADMLEADLDVDRLLNEVL
jgi:adenosylcobyric acid synthase